jgi:mRNA interferase YafQ
MPSNKRTADSKRAPLPLESAFAKAFKKDWDRLSRSGRYDMNRLKEAILLLIANDGPLGAEWLDHLGIQSPHSLARRAAFASRRVRIRIIKPMPSEGSAI